MKKSIIRFTFLFIALLLFSNAWASNIENSTKAKMLSHLEVIRSTFQVQYAPSDWKKSFTGWDLNTEIEKAKQEVQRTEKITVKQYQKILKNLFISVKDYHVGVRFVSTESASLPFIVKGLSGRYYFSYIDRFGLPYAKFPFKEGDELLTFDGRPIAKVINELKQTQMGDNYTATDLSLTDVLLTRRSGRLGEPVPQGTITLTGTSVSTTDILSCEATWNYLSEQIGDTPLRNFETLDFNPLNYVQPIREERLDIRSFLPDMTTYLWDKTDLGDDNMKNVGAIGARQSHLPYLGTKTWESPSSNHFHAYIFKTQEPNSRTIGYIRIPHYSADEDEAKAFEEIIAKFQMRTDALVIDQLNNPGGSNFYCNALASMLTDKPLKLPKHKMALTQKDVLGALKILPMLVKVKTSREAKQLVGETVGGYPASLELIQALIVHFKFVLSEWGAGRSLTTPSPLVGLHEIEPHPKAQYTKPILILINELDFSCGDFFPALLQDNQRAVVFGTRTAGAGGYVRNYELPNHFAVEGFSLTSSIAERKDNLPIENLGVTPDIAYELTEDDLRNDFRGYVKAVNDALHILLVVENGNLD